MKKFFQLLLAIGVVALTFAPNCRAQPGATDLTFDPGSATDATIYAIAKQSDGKIIIGGDFTIAEQDLRGRIARLNADGSLDTSFGDGLDGADSGVYSVALQSDGKVLIGGDFTSVNGVTRNSIARLNTDGSLDTSFGDGLDGADSGVDSVALQSDGHVLIGGTFTSVNGVTRNFIARLNADGSLDTDFEADLDGADSAVYSVVVQSDGKVLIGGTFTNVSSVTGNSIARLNADGSLDTSFGDGLDGVGGAVRSVAAQSDGKVLIGGTFTNVNGVTRNSIARLNADGSLDTGFGADLAGADGTVYSVTVQSDGKVLIGGDFTNVSGVTRNSIARLNADGWLDTSFGTGLTGADGAVCSLAVQSDGKVLIGGGFLSVNGVTRCYIARLNAGGSLDTGFGDSNPGVIGYVTSVAVQNDGKVLIGGSIGSIISVTCDNITRLNTDGSLDTSFGAGLDGPNDLVNSIAVQNDGKVLVGGWFQSVNDVTRLYIARLNADGSLDTNFGAGLAGADSGVYSVAVQSDGKVLIGGRFTHVNGVARNGIARLNTDGSLDTSFGDGLAGASGTVDSVVVQSDGKVLIGGWFTTVNGVTRNSIARLNADGSLDTSFGDGLTGADSGVYSVAVQNDGKVLIGGYFTRVNGMARYRIARLNADGSLDASFGEGLLGPNKLLYSVAVQSDGKVLIGGGFTTVNGVVRYRIARLNADGSLDTSYGAGLAGANGTVYSVVVQSDGKALIGGIFWLVNNVVRNGIARLQGDGPLMSIACSGSNMNLVWPAGWSGLVLQETADLGLPWNDVAQTPVNDGTNWSITLPATNACQFYRLKQE